MATNEILGELAREVFNPEPEPARRPTILVLFGIFISSTAVLAVFRPPSNIRLHRTESILCVFYIFLTLLFLFGVGLIVLGWFAAGNTRDYNAATRTAIRASQIVIAIAVGLFAASLNS